MGGRKSKIPIAYPGQLLLFTGIEEFDSKYLDLEKIIRKIKSIRLNIDYRLTDLIIALGAEKLWEKSPKFSEILKMLILVLSANLKHKINDISFEAEPPFLICSTDHCPIKIKFLYNDYKDYIEAVQEGLETLEKIDNNLDQNDLNEVIHIFPKNICQQIIEKEFSTEDKLKAVDNVNKNKVVIEEVISWIIKIKRLSEEIMNDAKETLKECKTTPKLEKILQQCLQAKVERISSPQDIVQKFWPFPHS